MKVFFKVTETDKQIALINIDDVVAIGSMTRNQALETMSNPPENFPDRVSIMSIRNSTGANGKIAVLESVLEIWDNKLVIK